MAVSAADMNDSDVRPAGRNWARWVVYAAVFSQLVSVESILTPGTFLDVETSDASSTAQIIALSLLICAVISTFRAKITLRSLGKSVLPLLPFVCWAVLSVTWSTFPDLTLRRSARILIDVATFAFAAEVLKRQESILQVYFRAFLLIVALDLASFAMPPVAFKDPWGYFSGIHFHKNAAGTFFAVAIPVFALGALSRSISGSRLLALAAMAVSVGMLMLTGAKTAMGVLVLGAALTGLTYLVVRQRGVESALAGLTLLGVMALVATIIFFEGLSETIGLLVGDSTLTGRDELWAYALHMYQQSPPLLGVGYGALWQNGDFIQQSLEHFGIDYVVNEAHNGYLDVTAQTGYVGLVCLILFLSSFLYRSIVLLRSPRAKGERLLGPLYGLYVLYGSMIFGITESVFFVGGVMLWTLQVAFSANAEPSYFVHGGDDHRNLLRKELNLNAASPNTIV